ncbi:Zinc finger protein 711 [Harpegnathos saltator]|uniref:Zinc finger protein 711 n=1 Tax=Harpegnathos saltator TaxID=610380 RepID=E2BAP5_HARSA|nr:Zinc finger protein 711 [Harpegnathos saltator]
MECWIKVWDHDNYKTNDEKKLESHIRVHSNKQEESNITGPEPFLSSTTYGKHSSTSSGIQECKNILYKYDDYNQKFCGENELTNHLTQNHKGLMHQFGHCNYETNDEKHLKCHILCVHPNIQEGSNIADPRPSWKSDDLCGKYSNRNSCIENNMLHKYDVCNQRFRTINELTNHLMEDHKDLMHQSEYCNYETNNEEHLKSQVQCVYPNIQKENNSSEPGPSWESDPCGEHSNTNSCIENNMPYECDACNQRFYRRYELIYHYKNAHRRLMYQCKHCIYGTNCEEDMKSHIRDHSNNQEESIIDPEPSLESDPCDNHSCKNSCIENNILHEYDVCNQRFRKINELTNHLTEDHKDFMSHREHCAYETNDEENLKDHIRRVHRNIQEKSNISEPVPSWENDPCTKYTSRNNSNEKYKIDQEQCQICNQKFCSEQELMHHLIKAHGRQTTFNCSQCTYKTNYKFNYQRHWNVKHKDNYDYPCTEPGCKWAFKSKQELKCYIRCNHSNQQEKSNIMNPGLSSESDLCSKRSSRGSSIKTYVKNSMDCPTCKQRFCYKKELIDHCINVHGRWAIFNCIHCSYETNNKRDYELHNKRWHEDNYVCTMPGCNCKGKVQPNLTHTTCSS